MILKILSISLNWFLLDWMKKKCEQRRNHNLSKGLIPSINIAFSITSLMA